jgi:HSP20 family protein
VNGAADLSGDATDGSEHRDRFARWIDSGQRVLKRVPRAPENLMPVFRLGHAWDPFRDLEREVDRLMQGVNMSLQGVRSSRRFPQMNLLDQGDRFVLTAEIPGVEPAQLEVTTAGGYLTIKGHRQPPAEAREDAFRRQERFHGSWQRSIQLPDRVLEDSVRADYSNGVLTITVPKAPSSLPRQIKVNEGP